MSNNRGSVPAWREVLDQIDQALAESLAVAIEPPALPAIVVSGPASVSIDERLAALQECLDRADRQAAAADAGVDADIEGLKRWWEQARQTGQVGPRRDGGL
jgi:hypothetical protein